jgi:adenylate kinase
VPQQLNVLLFGPQGSGKGTQAKRISAEYGIPHVSTGDMFRAAIAKQTPFGQKVAPILASGELVPDDLTVGLVRERLSEPDAEPGFVLDGFPRNIPQAEALDELLSELGRPLTAVLEFRISDGVAIERLLGRAAEEGRPDDTPEAIQRRLEIYHRDTEPLSDYYLASGKLVAVHAEGTVDEVWAEIQDALEQAQVPV